MFHRVQVTVTTADVGIMTRDVVCTKSEQQLTIWPEQLSLLYQPAAAAAGLRLEGPEAHMHTHKDRHKHKLLAALPIIAHSLMWYVQSSVITTHQVSLPTGASQI